MPATCIVCKSKHQSKKIDAGHRSHQVSMFRFPADQETRKVWLKALNLTEEDVKPHTRVCSRHFMNGDPSQAPSLHLGKRFYSPKKKAPVKRTARSSGSQFRAPKRPALTSPSVSPAPSLSSPPSSCADTLRESSDTDSSLFASIGEPLISDYSVHELPSTSSLNDSDNVVLNAGLLARVEYLESQLKKMKVSTAKRSYFRVEDISNNDVLIRFYTGFPSYEVFLAVFDFLGPAVNHLQYWGTAKRTVRLQRHKWKLNPKNQFFLTLMRLRLNCRVKDLAVRFGVSVGLVSRYVITWICFLYNHLKEIEWMPSPEQIAGNLPHVFKDKYPTTYAIIDGTEIFIQTPTDLQMQSSTWSEYKHHNTCKFLVACTPNGAVSYVSPVYVGSISDVKLTRISGFIEKLPPPSSHPLSIMADRGFTVRDQLKEVGYDLNIPAFLEGRKQLTAEECQQTRSIASVRIHVERAIGRIKNFAILNSTLPLTLSRLTNQIVSVCAWLTSFQPSLVPLPDSNSESMDEWDVEEYFDRLYDSDYDADDSDLDGIEDIDDL